MYYFCNFFNYMIEIQEKDVLKLNKNSLESLNRTQQEVSLQTLKINGNQYQTNSSEMSSQNTEISVYFLKGNDPKKLTENQQKQIYKFVQNDQFSESFLVYDPNQAIKRITKWKKQLPWIKPYFAIKSSPSLELAKDLLTNGAGMDCASKPQIQFCLKAGAAPQDIVFSNSIKLQKDLIYAEKLGIKLTTADTIEQILKINKYAPSMKILWRISIQEQLVDKLSSPFSGKFGDDLENDQQINARMKQIFQLNVNLAGIHFHCGSGINGATGFGRGINLARKCMQIGRLYGHQMLIMDIGGGFPQGDIPQGVIDSLKPSLKDPLGYQVIAEPGRHLSSRCFSVLTRVIGTRVKNNKRCLHVNQSVFHSFNCTIVDGVSFDNSQQFYSKIRNRDAEQLGQIKDSTLVGMTCDGMDIICKNFLAPRDLKIGDWLCFGGMGAYTYAIKSSFNGMYSADKIYMLNLQS